VTPLSTSGTRQGEVLQLGIDKPGMTTLWNSKSELIEGSDDEEFVNIRKMIWMYPQTPASEGCLFVLLGRRLCLTFLRSFPHQWP
jgi:hypothetical protein